MTDCLSQSNGSSLHPTPELCLKFLPTQGYPQGTLLTITVPSIPGQSGHSHVHSL